MILYQHIQHVMGYYMRHFWNNSSKSSQYNNNKVFLLKCRSGVYKKKLASVLALSDLHSSCEHLQEHNLRKELSLTLSQSHPVNCHGKLATVKKTELIYLYLLTFYFCFPYWASRTQAIAATRRKFFQDIRWLKTDRLSMTFLDF